MIKTIAIVNEIVQISLPISPDSCVFQKYGVGVTLFVAMLNRTLLALFELLPMKKTNYKNVLRCCLIKGSYNTSLLLPV